MCSQVAKVTRSPAWKSASPAAAVVGEHGGKIGRPAAEVVVDVDDRDPGPVSPLLDGRASPGHRQRVLEKLFPCGELQVVDDVDGQKGDVHLVEALPCRSSFF